MSEQESIYRSCTHLGLVDLTKVTFIPFLSLFPPFVYNVFPPYWGFVTLHSVSSYVSTQIRVVNRYPGAGVTNRFVGWWRRNGGRGGIGCCWCRVVTEVVVVSGSITVFCSTTWWGGTNSGACSSAWSGGNSFQ